jgi:hypothetical protein
MVDDIRERPLDSNVAGLILNTQVIDFHWLHRRNSDLRNATRQVRSEVVEGVSKAGIELWISSTAFLNEWCWGEIKKID